MFLPCRPTTFVFQRSWSVSHVDLRRLKPLLPQALITTFKRLRCRGMSSVEAGLIVITELGNSGEDAFQEA